MRRAILFAPRCVAWSAGLWLLAVSCASIDATSETGGDTAAGEALVFAKRAPAALEPECDETPTGVASDDDWLHFMLPVGLMPDDVFDGRPAKLHVHSVRPVYAHGRCPWVPAQTVVLIHGRSSPGPVAFDVRHHDGGELSVQEALAWAGIDTFAPSLLGYGRSTRFDEGLNDPCNASLRRFEGGACPHPEGCDTTTIEAVFPLDQQGTALTPNPLVDGRCAHSSDYRFARVDVWVRDIRQVVDYAIEVAQPSDRQVVLVGYSAGAQRVGRALFANPNPVAYPPLPDTALAIAKISKVVFMAPVPYGGTTEEPTSGYHSYPLTLHGLAGSNSTWNMPALGEAACPGHVIPDTKEEFWAQSLEHDRVGRDWGTSGLVRSPTFSGYGFNAEVVGQLDLPVLVIQGMQDPVALPAIGCSVFNAVPPTVTNKVFVQIDCASHALMMEGCDPTEPRCTPSSGTPYGGGTTWAGPHRTVQAALIEWIKTGTFDGVSSGRFRVNASGVASAGTPGCLPPP